MQVSQVRDASAPQHKEYTDHIFASEILGCPLTANDMGYMNAFREGLSTRLMPSFPTLIEVCFTILFSLTMTNGDVFRPDTW